MKRLFFTIFSVTAATLAYGQIGTAPQIGSEYNYVILNATVADTGANGTGITWDFSTFEADESGTGTLIYREPTAQELTNDPTISVVVESLGGQTMMYASNADSLYQVGIYDSFADMYVAYTDPAVTWILPANENLSNRSDAFMYTYEGEFDLTSTGTTNWVISGQGTLITPYMSYSNVQKVSRYTEVQVFTTEFELFSYTSTEIIFFNSDMSIPLLIFNYDDLNETLHTYVRYEQPTSAGLTDEYMERVLFHPNPANDHIQLHQSVDSYNIVSMDGKVIATGTNNGNIDLTTFAPGTYMLQLTSAYGIRSEKLVIR